MRKTRSEHGVGPGFEELLAMIAAATVALIFGLVGGVSWGKYLLLMGGGAAIIGAFVYTFRAMCSAGRIRPANGIDQPENRLPQRRVHLQPRPGGETQEAFGQPTSEPYPHHENYPESAGQDQGQLTSHLPGSTPLVAEPDTQNLTQHSK